MNKRIITLAFAFMALYSFASAQLNVTGEIRTRGEYRDGYKMIPTSNNDPISLISQRTRLNLSYAKDKFTTKISFQDVRIWGDNDIYTPAGSWGNSKSVDFHEGWFQYAVNDKLSFKIGRQELSYDDERLLASRNWLQYGLSYDAAVIKYKSDLFNVDLGLSVNNDAESLFNESFYPATDTLNKNNRMKHMHFVHISKNLSDKLYVSLLGMMNGYQDVNDPSEVYNTITTGLHIAYTSKALKVKGNYFIQRGENKTGDDVEASFAGIDAQYNVVPKKLSLVAGVDYISGDDGTDNIDNTFDIMYGARIKYYGFTNQFIFIGKPWDKGGLINAYGKVNLTAHKGGNLSLQYHNYSFAETYMGLDKGLGHEIDLIYKAKIDKNFSVMAGLAYMSATDDFYTAKGITDTSIASNPTFGWLTLTFKPTFL